MKLIELYINNKEIFNAAYKVVINDTVFYLDKLEERLSVSQFSYDDLKTRISLFTHLLEYEK